MKAKTWLSIIFLLTIVTRLILAFTIPNLTYDSYFHMRQVDHITHHGLPIHNDELSYGGREFFFLPFFHYAAAFFDLFLPIDFVAKLLPNLLFASLTILVYLISKQITKNDTGSLYAAFAAGFLPILFSTNSFTPESLFLPLVFLAIYAFMNLNKQKHVYIYIASFLLLSLTSSATTLLLIGFGIYLLLSFIEGKRVKKGELELILFSLFFFVWIQFLFFKNVLLEQGTSFIWQNIPSQILLEYFPQLSIAEALILVSFIPFIAGIYVVYRSLFQLKNTKSFLLISLAISTTILTWLRLIQFKLSLAFFGIILAILFASFYKEGTEYLSKTKAAGWQKAFAISIAILLAGTMVYPAVQTALEQDTPTDNDLEVFQWVQVNIPEQATVLASLQEGHLVTYVGKRRNVMDDQFGLVHNVEERYADHKDLFTSQLQTQAIGLLNKYEVQYLMLTPQVKETHNIKNFPYRTSECFDKIFDNEQTRIYRLTCVIEQT